MDIEKMKLINRSSQAILPEDVINSLSATTMHEFNDALLLHNLRIDEYEKIMDAGHLIEQKITIIDAQLPLPLKI